MYQMRSSVSNVPRPNLKPLLSLTRAVAKPSLRTPKKRKETHPKTKAPHTQEKEKSEQSEPGRTRNTYSDGR